MRERDARTTTGNEDHLHTISRPGVYARRKCRLQHVESGAAQ